MFAVVRSPARGRLIFIRVYEDAGISGAKIADGKIILPPLGPVIQQRRRSPSERVTMPIEPEGHPLAGGGADTPFEFKFKSVLRAHNRASHRAQEWIVAAGVEDQQLL